jgi:cation:H+ antiporter
MLVATPCLLLALVGIDLKLDRRNGISLFGVLLLYLGQLFIHRKVMPRSEAMLSRLTWFHEAPATELQNGRVLGMALVLTVMSALPLIGAASGAAKGFGVSEWAIGVTIVAAGTFAARIRLDVDDKCWPKRDAFSRPATCEAYGD